MDDTPVCMIYSLDRRIRGGVVPPIRITAGNRMHPFLATDLCCDVYTNYQEYVCARATYVIHSLISDRKRRFGQIGIHSSESFTGSFNILMHQVDTSTR